MIGKRFGRLTVCEEEARGKHGHRQFSCICDCGTTTVVAGAYLRSGNTTSCGCFRRERIVETKTKHGHCRGKHNSPEYVSWRKMIERCTDVRNNRYEFYGKRGVRVCDEWLHSFEMFLAHIGPRPSPKHSIDRINVEGNYEPGNVRWATPEMQVTNRRMLKSNTTGFVGVSLAAGRPKPYHAQIRISGHNQHLGFFSTPEEASAAYERMRCVRSELLEKGQ